jgi:hypothetical protein
MQLRRFLLRKDLPLSINEVVHHDDVVSLIIVGSWCNIACRDPYPSYERIAENNPENDRLPSPGDAGTKLLNRTPSAYWRRGCPASSQARSHLAGQRL